MRRFEINKNDGGQRLDKFVSKTVWGLPPSLMYKYIRTKRIKVNGKRTKENQILLLGDVVEMYIPDEFFEKKTDSVEYDNVKVNLNIVYEDDNILLCDKKPGMLVHNGDEGDPNVINASERDTLIFMIKAYLYQKGEYDPKSENSFSPALCNRIDRNTGGIVIAAKTAEALREMNDLIKSGCIDKRYLCAVHGRPNPPKATLRGYLFKNTKTKTVRIDSVKTPGSKEAITSYSTLTYNDEHNISLLEVKLITGRTHQIRAHLASVGHSLLGDGKYGINKADRALGFKSQALYSYKLTFNVNNGLFEYLSGKTFSVSNESIYFLKLFRGFC